MTTTYLQQAFDAQPLRPANVNIARDEVMREAATACYVAGKAAGAHSGHPFATLPALITDVADSPYEPMIDAWLEEAASDAAAALGAWLHVDDGRFVIDVELPERNHAMLVDRAAVLIRRLMVRRVVSRWLALTGFAAGIYEASATDCLSDLRALRIYGSPARIRPF